MCPDRHILSVYFDGELPSPWKEKMEAHLASCRECKVWLEQYRHCSQALGSPATAEASGNAALEAAQERVWLKISQGAAGISAFPRRQNPWARRVSIPLPVAAAAAVLLVIACVLSLTRTPAVSAPATDTFAGTGMGLGVQEMVPISDQNGVLQYLEQENTADILIIRLPETKSFKSAGEPTILKAADYSRRNVPR
ncbi:MAG: zf-HC2 domain-containing protein [Treponema sp.]|jgi:predicted anti-sigma-YlaC factor YlaD|nr:zf-HC2 domain-containing protein [Treponema sp.]